MTYVDGFVLPIKKNKIAEYCKMSRVMGKLMRKNGAIGYYECVGDELNVKFSSLKYKKMAKAKAGETVVFAFIMYKSKADRNRINQKVMNDPSMSEGWKDKPVPFDMKRMAVGGFKVVVDE